MLKELHVVKVWSWSIRKDVSKGKGGARREDEIISLLLVQMISMTDEIFRNKTALDKLPSHLINGVGGISQRMYWDIYNKFYPFCSEICHKNDMLNNVSVPLGLQRSTFEITDCSILESSLNLNRRAMIQRIEKRFVLDIGFYYCMSSKLVLSENVTVHLKDLLPSILDTDEISNYAIDALVYLVQHGMMYDGKKMIPLPSTANMASFDNILLSVSVLSYEGDLKCTTQNGVRLFDLSDLHIYYFFHNRNIYIPVVEEYPMYENEGFFEVEDIEFFKHNYPVMSIRNLVMIREKLMVLAQFYLSGVTGGFDLVFHAGKSQSVLLWYPMRQLKDLRMLMFYIKIHCPWIKKNSCNQLYEKNLVGLFDPCLTEHQYYLQSNYWDEIHRKSVPEHIQMKSMEIKKYYDTKTRFEKGLYSEYREADERFMKSHNIQQNEIIEESMDEGSSSHNRKRKKILDKDALEGKKLHSGNKKQKNHIRNQQHSGKNISFLEKCDCYRSFQHLETS